MFADSVCSSRIRLRSALYVAANTLERYGSALAARPDAVIIDLEDAVRADDKTAARHNLMTLVSAARAAEVGAAIRVNGADTEWFTDDVDAALGARPDAIVVPKAGADQLQLLDARLPAAERPAVWCMIETVRDALAVDAMLDTGLVSTVTIGYGDLCKELDLPLGAEHPEFAGIRELVVAAARRHDVVALDGVVVGGPDAAAGACRRSVDDGFTGRTLYDRRHVEGCHLAFDEAGLAGEVVSRRGVTEQPPTTPSPAPPPPQRVPSTQPRRQ
jgi:citrate lyase subunit beta / citryl-CoA lyase